MMAVADAFLKPQVEQQMAKIVKADVGVRCASEDLQQNLVALTHPRNLARNTNE